MRTHRLSLHCIALCLTALAAGCSGDLAAVKTRPLPEQASAFQVAPVDSAAIVHREEFRALLNDGQQLFRQRRFDEAAATLYKAIGIDPDHWQPYYFMGLVKAQTEEFSAAEAFLSTGLRLAPDDPRVRCQIHVALGENCESQALYDPAARHYRAALRLHPDSEAARQGLARLEKRLRLPDR